MILNIPDGPQFDPKSLVVRDVRYFSAQFRVQAGRGGLDRTSIEKNFGRIASNLRRVALEAAAHVIDPIEELCDLKCYALSEDGIPRYKDAAHLTPSFVRSNVRFLDKTLRN